MFAWLVRLTCFSLSLKQQRIKNNDGTESRGRYLVRRRCVLCTLAIARNAKCYQLRWCLCELILFQGTHTHSHFFFPRFSLCAFFYFVFFYFFFVALCCPYRRWTVIVASVFLLFLVHVILCWPVPFARSLASFSPSLIGFCCCWCVGVVVVIAVDGGGVFFLLRYFHLSRELKNNGTHERNVVVSSNRLIINNKSA